MMNDGVSMMSTMNDGGTMMNNGVSMMSSMNDGGTMMNDGMSMMSMMKDGVIMMMKEGGTTVNNSGTMIAVVGRSSGSHCPTGIYCCTLKLFYSSYKPRKKNYTEYKICAIKKRGWPYSVWQVPFFRSPNME